MRQRLALAFVLSTFTLAACSEPTTPAAAPEVDAPSFAAGDNGQGRIPGEYIVVFDDAVDDAPGLAKQLAAQHGADVRFTYTAVLKGFAASLSPQAAEAIARNPNVAYVEQDQEMTASATQSGATWGLDRIDQRNRPLSGTYTYTSTASAVRAYIIDTGLQSNHPQFGSRAMNVYDALGGNGEDCNGHGTHVAGTVGASTYGVAKAVMLRGVRVLNCSGSGATSGIIAAVDWVRLNRINPAVANLSLGGGYSSALNTAVTNLHNSGVFVAVAAGNSNANACNYSPASASNVVSVAATTSTDAKASFSNYGSCVELYAPGASITSAWIGSGTSTISGTSMASPHVAGVAALYKGNYGDAASSTIRSWIINNATSSVVSGNPSGTPNKLLYKAGL